MKNLILALGITLAGPVFAQSKTADVPAAPLPAQILSASKVFISYAGGENLETPFALVFSGRSDRVYNDFYAAMKQWGRYELVSTPADADVILQIGFTFGDNGIKAPEMGRLRLEIRDPRSNVLLWALSQYVQAAIRKGNRDKNLDLAMKVIVAAVKDLVSPATAPAPAQP
jgi:hypothetical protein